MKKIITSNILFFLIFGTCFSQNYFNRIYRYSALDSANRQETLTPVLELQNQGNIDVGFTEQWNTKESRIVVFNQESLGKDL